MIEISKKRDHIRECLRGQQMEAYFKTIRQQLIQKCDQEQYLTQTEQVFILAYLKSETQEADLFNIYANIESELNEVLTNHQALDFVSKLAVWLYLQLTSCQAVIDYVCQMSPVVTWTLMQLLLVKFPKCEEYVYDRMRVFLQNACQRQQLNPYHCFGQQRYNGQLLSIFSHSNTQNLADFPVPIDDQSQYYEFVNCYVSLMPSSHVIPLINQGFPQIFIESTNNSILLTFLGRLQLLSQTDSLFLQYYTNLSDLFYQRQAIGKE